LWLFFYGRPRRGVPWLLIAVVVGVVLLALTFALPGGADMWRSVAPILIGVLLVGAIVAAIAAALRPRRR
jgi:glycerol uptake facilitator-like aquaporin